MFVSFVTFKSKRILRLKDNMYPLVFCLLDVPVRLEKRALKVGHNQFLAINTICYLIN